MKAKICSNFLYIRFFLFLTFHYNWDFVTTLSSFIISYNIKKREKEKKVNGYNKIIG